MSQKEKLNKIKQVIDVLNEMAPYVPPPLRGMEYLFLNQGDLYITTITEDNVYRNRLAMLLKEECSFIKNVYFIKKEEEKNE